MRQRVIFIAREFLEKVSKVETMQKITEAGIELSHLECLLYKKNIMHKNFQGMYVCCKVSSALLHSTEGRYFM